MVVISKKKKKNAKNAYAKWVINGLWLILIYALPDRGPYYRIFFALSNSREIKRRSY
jgi:hypothetical protein